jgi:replicative DNA helicase
VEYYAAQVRETYIRKQLHKIGSRLVETSGDKSKDTNELIEKAERLIFEMNEIQTGQYTHASVPLMSAVDLIEEYHNRKGGYLGIPCGLKAVDDILSGFQPEDLIVIGARASIGKTALAMTMAANMAKVRPVGFFSLEMSATALLVRLVSMYGRIPNNRIRYGMMDKKDFDGLHRAGNEITNGQLYIYDHANAGIMDIKAKARRMKKREGVEAIFVDYIGLIQPDRRDLPRHEQISSVCKELKNLAREIRVPVIALAQLNRLAEGKKPGLSELKESGALEEDADVVMLLHREREEEGNSRLTEVNIAKHRNGPTDKVPLIYLPQFTRFETYTGETS